jgi:FtsP/CotA-like multicopper oxidase with cupredoxin domain
MKRRKFIQTSTLGSCSVFISSSVISVLSSCSNSENLIQNNQLGMNSIPIDVIQGNFSNLLPIPMTTNGVLTLRAQNTTTIINNSIVNVLGYQSNNILGLTIKVNNGSNVSINLQNQLSNPTNIHWHGLKIPSDMDGYPTEVANSNTSFNYQFSVNQRAGLYWYHPHTDGLTAEQVFKGLAGLFIVNDSEEQALNLPSDAYEIPLVIQDKRITNNNIIYNPSMSEVMSGYMGDVILVNGESFPYINVETRYYRFRILNGSNARIYNLALSNNAFMTIIGNDAGLIQAPLNVQSIIIGPGERLDVLINFSGLVLGEELFLENKIFSGAGSAQGKQTFNILKFKISNIVNDNFNPPTTLSHIIPINTSLVSKFRNFDISNNGMGMTGNGMQHTINNKTFDSNRIDEVVNANATEIWTFDNSQGTEPHPMHIHGVQFQVIQRIGGRNQLIASESGWKDTVLVMPGEIVKVIISFENLTGKFVFHCHNLEHEDSGMMLQYKLV